MTNPITCVKCTRRYAFWVLVGLVVLMAACGITTLGDENAGESVYLGTHTVDELWREYKSNQHAFEDKFGGRQTFVHVQGVVMEFGRREVAIGERKYSRAEPFVVDKVPRDKLLDLRVGDQLTFRVSNVRGDIVKAEFLDLKFDRLIIRADYVKEG